MNATTLSPAAAPLWLPGDAETAALRRLDRRLARAPLIAATYLSKIGIPGLAALGLSFSIPFICLALGAGVAAGRFVVAERRLAAYLLLFSLLWSVQLFCQDSFSPASLLMLGLLHLPDVFALRTQGDRRLHIWIGLRSVCTVIAGCALAQYALQFVIGQPAAFPLDNYLPESMRVLGFNNQGWIEYGSSVIRANGIFMLEPSFLSQLLAVGIAGELAYGHMDVRRIALFAAALIVSYSGTGILALMVGLPIWIVEGRRWKLLTLLVLLGLALLALLFSGIAADNPYLKVFAERSTEFSSTGSSGFARFVGGFYMFDQFLWPDTFRSLFGYGAGSFLSYSLQANYAAHGMALFKMVFEYGLVGGALYFGFLAWCIASSRAPALIRAVVLVPMMLQNFSPFAHGLFIALLIWNSPESPRSVQEERPWV